MNLLDGKRKEEGYGNPEFFLLDDFKGKIRFRRSSLMQYDCILDEEEEKFKIELRFNHAVGDEGNNKYTYSVPKDRVADKDRILAKLDKLMNVKEI